VCMGRFRTLPNVLGSGVTVRGRRHYWGRGSITATETFHWPQSGPQRHFERLQERCPVSFGGVLKFGAHIPEARRGGAVSGLVSFSHELLPTK